MHLLTKFIFTSGLVIALSACTKDGGFFFSSSHQTDLRNSTPTNTQMLPSSNISNPDNSPASLSNGSLGSAPSSSNQEAQAPLNSGVNNSSTSAVAETTTPSSNVIPVGKLVPINKGTPTIKNENNKQSSIINTD